MPFLLLVILRRFARTLLMIEFVNVSAKTQQSQLIKRPRHGGELNVPGRLGLPAQAALSAARRCAVDTFTAKVSSIGRDSKTGLNASLIVS